MYSGFLRGSARSQQQVLRRVGAVAIVAVIAIYIVVAQLIPAITPDDGSIMKVSVDTPYVGPGVAAGTKVMLRGSNVGEVSEVIRNSGGGITLDLELDKGLVAGIKEDFVLDFRPSNYFGITALTISDPGRSGPAVLPGDHLETHPGGDYTMARMIEEGSRVSNGSLTDSTMQAIAQVLAYTEALSPLIHTGVVVADTVSRTQREMPSELIEKFNNIVEGMPEFSAGAIDGVYAIFDSGFLYVGDDIRDRMSAGLDAIATKFFGMVGHLLGSNEDNLYPATEIIREAAGILPAMVGGGFDGTDLKAMIDRLGSAFAPGPDGSTSLRVEVALDALPGLQSVFGTQVAASGTPGGMR